MSTLHADPATVAAAGRARDLSADSTDRAVAVFVHVGWLAGIGLLGPLTLLVPLGLWLARRDHSGFVDDHGRATLDFLCSVAILSVGLAITVIGVLLLPVLAVVALVSAIRGAVAAHRGEYFRYPLAFGLFG